jgi:uncharacterized membrane protein
MSVTHEIHIAAPPERVWAVTCDIERWPEWTPTVTSVTRKSQDEFGLGSVARIKQPLQPESEWTVILFEPERRFAWESIRTGLRFVAVHELLPDDSGTKNILRLEATGFLAILMRPILRAAVGRALRQENRGLKARCEAKALPGRKPAAGVGSADGKIVEVADR